MEPWDSKAMRKSCLFRGQTSTNDQNRLKEGKISCSILHIEKEKTGVKEKKLEQLTSSQ